jgi:tetratricopeptide (TPR) repeat protein
MADSAADLEQRAERAVRRGELLTAIELFEQLLATGPVDDRLRQRVESVRALLQPSELQDRRDPGPEVAEPEVPMLRLSDAEQGELHASAGRFAQAIRCYERAAAAAPSNELLSERLEELRELVAPGTPADLASAERIPAPAPAHSVARESRSHKLAHASFAPLEQGSGSPLPKDPVKLLEALLERVRAGRR